MSYEHNHSIQFDLDHLSQYENVIELDKKRIELDRVYAQAAKADEYEAKAKAYNDTLKTLDKLINDDERYKEARSNDFIAGMIIAYEKIFYLMEDYIKESGGYDA